MFTGIIHGQGQVQGIQPSGGEMRLALRALFPLEALCIGESIAVNGVCLTVEEGISPQFTAYASAETMQRTNLGALRPGSLVNLERALAVGDRFGGHMVSGHVDCLATVRLLEKKGSSLCVRLEFPAHYSPEVIGKGSVTLDGISLTINDCGPTFLEVNVIPETASVTTVSQWTVGRSVNMETDIIGKYVRHMLRPWQESGQESAPQSTSHITEDFLKEQGII